MVNENRDCQPVLFIVYQETATKRNTKISLLNSCPYTFHEQTSDKILLQTEEVSFFRICHSYFSFYWVDPRAYLISRPFRLWLGLK